MFGTENSGQYVRATDLVIWAANLGDLLAAYGGEFHAFAVHELHERLADCGISPHAVDMHDDLVLINLQKAWPNTVFDQNLESALLQFVNLELEYLPVEFETGKAYLRIQAGYLREVASLHGLDVQDVIETDNLSNRPLPLSALWQKWRIDYRTHMNLAVRLLDDLREARLRLAFQNIEPLNQTGADKSLYYEALLRHEKGRTDYSVPMAIAALEQVGLITRLDRSVMTTVIGVLENNPTQKLGCNISARSLSPDAWWQNVLDYLQQHRQVARRLIIEITETSSVIQLKEAKSLITGLQARGVQIALDDLGAGNSTLEFLAQCSADIVKIDRSILLRSRNLHHSPDLLRNLVRLCSDYSSTVIIEGVESKPELDAARYSGAQGVQGFFIAMPQTEPTWLNQPVMVIDSAGQSDQRLCQALELSSPPPKPLKPLQMAR